VGRVPPTRPTSEPGTPFLEKPFSANDLPTKIRERLDAAA
jgi:hypothetical protein